MALAFSLSQPRKKNALWDANSVYVDPRELLFGEAWAQDSAFEWTICIHNRGNSPFSISKFKTSCRCTAISPESVQIEPGEHADIRLTLDLATTDREVGELPERTFSVDIHPVIIPELNRAILWRLTGIVSNAFDITPPLANFEDKLVAGHPFPSKVIAIRYRKPWQTVRAHEDPAFGRVVVHHSHDDRRQFRVEVLPSESLPPGPFDFRVPIIGETMSGETLAPLPLRVVGRVRPTVQLTPEKLWLGVHARGSTIRRSIEVRALEDTITLSKVESESQAIQVRPKASGYDRTHKIDLEIALDETGQFASYVDVVTNRQGVESGEFNRLTISGYATENVREYKLPIQSDGVSLR
jgi:hypothetical protein